MTEVTTKNFFPNVIGIAGASGAGKDTVANYLVKHYGYKKYELKAGLIREVHDKYGLDVELLRGQTEESRAWRCTPQVELGGRTPLDIMIEIGEGRRVTNPSYWYDYLMGTVSEPVEKQPIVIPDVRRYLEAMRIRQMGFLIYLERGEPKLSIAEKDLPIVEDMAHHVIRNNDTVAVLHTRINGCLRLWSKRFYS